jgi:hypothetical protein
MVASLGRFASLLNAIQSPGTVGDSDNVAIVTDYREHVEPWLNMAKRATPTHVPFDPLACSFIEEQPFSTTTARCRSEPFEQLDDIRRNGPLQAT